MIINKPSDHSLHYSGIKVNPGTEEMALQLRAQTALAEDLDLAPSTHKAVYSHMELQFRPPWAPSIHVVHIHNVDRDTRAYIHIKRLLEAWVNGKGCQL